MAVRCVCAWIVGASIVAAAKPPAIIIEFAEQSRLARISAIADCKTAIASTDTRAAEYRKNKSMTAEQKRATLKGLRESEERNKELLEQLREVNELFYAQLPPNESLQMGDVGLSKGGSWKAFQVVDEENCLVAAVWTERYMVRVRHVGNRDVAEYGRRKKEKMLWLSGVDTSGFADGNFITIPEQVYHLDGNKTYESPVGTNTVVLVQPLDISEWEHLFTRQSEMREWTSARGNHTMKAVLDGYQRRRVVLRDADSKVKRVDPSDLSEEDQEFIMEWRKQYGDLAEKDGS